jgi:general stress protein 26
MAEASLDRFWSLLEGVPVCMMTTRDAGTLRSRPMVPIVDRTTREFRFLTRLSSHKIDELAEKPDVNLAFANPAAGDFVSVSGQAYLTQDRKLIDQLWSADAAVYLERSRESPEIAVIRVVPSMAEHWDASSALIEVWDVFRTGRSRPEPDLVERRSVGLR